MKLLKPPTVLLLAFALIRHSLQFRRSSDASSTKATAKARTIDEIKKSDELRIAVFGDKNHLVMLTTTVLTKVMISN